jgi:hypothetical protein
VTADSPWGCGGSGGPAPARPGAAPTTGVVPAKPPQCSTLGCAVAVEIHTEPPVRCPNCRGPMRLIGFLPASPPPTSIRVSHGHRSHGLVSMRHNFAQSKSQVAARLGRRTTAFAFLPATNTVPTRLPVARLQPRITVACRFPPALSPPPPLRAELHDEPLP